MEKEKETRLPLFKSTEFGEPLTRFETVLANRLQYWEQFPPVGVDMIEKAISEATMICDAVEKSAIPALKLKTMALDSAHEHLHKMSEELDNTRIKLKEVKNEMKKAKALFENAALIGCVASVVAIAMTILYLLK